MDGPALNHISNETVRAPTLLIAVVRLAPGACPDSAGSDWEGWLGGLPAAEQHRIRRLRRPIDQSRAVVGQYLLRYLVPGGGEFPRTPRGRPELSPSHPLAGRVDVNITHHGRVVGGVCSRGTGPFPSGPEAKVPVGIDVMDVSGTVDDYGDLIRDQFSPAEQRWVAQGPDARDRTARFFVVWTLKESFLKATGMGLVDRLDQLSFSVQGDLGPAGPGPWLGLTVQMHVGTEADGELGAAAGGQEWHFRVARIEGLPEPHYLSICWGAARASSDPALIWRELAPAQLLSPGRAGLADCLGAAP